MEVVDNILQGDIGEGYGEILDFELVFRQKHLGHHTTRRAAAVCFNGINSCVKQLGVAFQLLDLSSREGAKGLTGHYQNRLAFHVAH